MAKCIWILKVRSSHNKKCRVIACCNLQSLWHFDSRWYWLNLESIFLHFSWGTVITILVSFFFWCLFFCCLLVLVNWHVTILRPEWLMWDWQIFTCTSTLLYWPNTVLFVNLFIKLLGVQIGYLSWLVV